MSVIGPDGRHDIPGGPYYRSRLSQAERFNAIDLLAEAEEALITARGKIEEMEREAALLGAVLDHGSPDSEDVEEIVKLHGRAIKAACFVEGV